MKIAPEEQKMITTFEDVVLKDGTILKKIPTINEKYRAGSDGRIYSYCEARTNAKKEKPFPLSLTKSTFYYTITVPSVGKKKNYNTHRLICMAFHGESPFIRACVRHLDGDWSNNRPENLKWGTYSENESDKKRHGTAATGERQGSAKLTEDSVRIIRASIPYGLWNSRDAATVFGVTAGAITQIANGRGWKHVK